MSFSFFYHLGTIWDESLMHDFEWEKVTNPLFRLWLSHSNRCFFCSKVAASALAVRFFWYSFLFLIKLVGLRSPIYFSLHQSFPMFWNFFWNPCYYSVIFVQKLFKCCTQGHTLSLLLQMVDKGCGLHLLAHIHIILTQIFVKMKAKMEIKYHAAS